MGSEGQRSIVKGTGATHHRLKDTAIEKQVSKDKDKNSSLAVQDHPKTGQRHTKTTIFLSRQELIIGKRSEDKDIDLSIAIVDQDSTNNKESSDSPVFEDTNTLKTKHSISKMIDQTRRNMSDSKVKKSPVSIRYSSSPTLQDRRPPEVPVSHPGKTSLYESYNELPGCQRTL